MARCGDAEGFGQCLAPVDLLSNMLTHCNLALMSILKVFLFERAGLEVSPPETRCKPVPGALGRQRPAGSRSQEGIPPTPLCQP